MAGGFGFSSVREDHEIVFYYFIYLMKIFDKKHFLLDYKKYLQPQTFLQNLTFNLTARSLFIA